MLQFVMPDDVMAKVSKPGFRTLQDVMNTDVTPKYVQPHDIKSANVDALYILDKMVVKRHYAITIYLNIFVIPRHQTMELPHTRLDLH